MRSFIFLVLASLPFSIAAKDNPSVADVKCDQRLPGPYIDVKVGFFFFPPYPMRTIFDQEEIAEKETPSVSDAKENPLVSDAEENPLVSDAEENPSVSNAKENLSVSEVKCDHRLPAPYIDVKAGYFFYTSSPMSKVYDQGGLDVQLSGGYPICYYLNIYGSFEYLEKSGKSLNLGQRTSIWEIPLSIGLQPNFYITSWARFYFTLGPRYIFAYVHNHSTFVPRHMHANGFAGFANMGFLFNIYRGLTIDLFGEYSYSKLRFHTSHPGTEGHRVQVGGLTFGGGLGYSF